MPEAMWVEEWPGMMPWAVLDSMAVTRDVLRDEDWGAGVAVQSTAGKARGLQKVGLDSEPGVAGSPVM